MQTVKWPFLTAIRATLTNFIGSILTSITCAIKVPATLPIVLLIVVSTINFLIFATVFLLKSVADIDITDAVIDAHPSPLSYVISIFLFPAIYIRYVVGYKNILRDNPVFLFASEKRELWLQDMVAEQSREMGLKAPPSIVVFDIDGPAIDPVFVIGTNFSSSILAIQNHFLKTCPRNALLFIIRHELSHIRRGDSLILSTMQLIVGLANMLHRIVFKSILWTSLLIALMFAALMALSWYFDNYLPLEDNELLSTLTLFASAIGITLTTIFLLNLWQFKLQRILELQSDKEAAAGMAVGDIEAAFDYLEERGYSADNPQSWIPHFIKNLFSTHPHPEYRRQRLVALLKSA